MYNFFFHNEQARLKTVLNSGKRSLKRTSEHRGDSKTVIFARTHFSSFRGSKGGGGVVMVVGGVISFS